MPRKLRELRADLRRAGFYIDHQTGSHEFWRHDDLPEWRMTLAGKDSKDADFYLEKDLRVILQALRDAQKRKQTP